MTNLKSTLRNRKQYTYVCQWIVVCTILYNIFLKLNDTWEKKIIDETRTKKKHDQKLRKFNNIQKKLNLKKREHLKIIVLKTKKKHTIDANAIENKHNFIIQNIACFLYILSKTKMRNSMFKRRNAKIDTFFIKRNFLNFKISSYIKRHILIFLMKCFAWIHVFYTNILFILIWISIRNFEKWNHALILKISISTFSNLTNK